MIELCQATKRYGPKEALHAVDLRIPEGCVLGLLGVNGAGKTTALNLMTGYFPPTSGSVRVDGMDMLTQPRACKRRIGYLPEQPPLYDEMSVAGFLTFVSRLREVKDRDIPGHVKDICGLCGLEEVAGRPVGKLSKGYRQRVGIASALCGDPPTLILDEPTVGLDPRQVVEIRSLIRTLGETHTVVFSSHLLPEVQQLCTRVAILHQGRLVREGSLEELQGGSRRLRLEALGAPEKLLPALRGLPGVQRVLPQETGEAGVTAVFLECEEKAEISEALFRLLCALDAPIRLLAPERDSLEEIFLRLTAGKEAP